MALYLGVSNDGSFISSDGYTLKDSNNLFLRTIVTTHRHKIILNNVTYRVNVNLKKRDGE